MRWPTKLEVASAARIFFLVWYYSLLVMYYIGEWHRPSASFDENPAFGSIFITITYQRSKNRIGLAVRLADTNCVCMHEYRGNGVWCTVNSIEIVQKPAQADQQQQNIQNIANNNNNKKNQIQ